jgi:hypothetical protein
MLLSYFFLEGGLVGVYGTPILEVVACDKLEVDRRLTYEKHTLYTISQHQN